MKVAARGLPAGIVAASLAVFAADNVRDVNAVPNLRGEKGREGYAAFLAANPVRAFAVAEGGASGWRSGQESRAKAVGGALYNCNKPARNVCRVYAIDGDVVYAMYADFERKSAKMVDALRGVTLAFAEYGDEEKDMRVPVATGARREVSDPADTPLLAEGVKIRPPEIPVPPCPPGMVNLYQQDGASIRQLANRYGHSYNQTRNMLLRAGVQLRPRGQMTGDRKRTEP